MADKFLSSSRIRNAAWTLMAVLLSIAIAAFAFSDLPTRFGIRAATSDGQNQPGQQDADDGHLDDEHAGHDHSGHDHSGHADTAPVAHSEEDSIELSPQARGNLGLETELVSTSSFTQYVSMPGTIIDWPGRTHVSVTATLTGVVSAIHISRGELIRSGQPLFALRLTHQDLVKTQSDFLAALGRMDVENREIERLTLISRSGAIAGKTLIQREYERDKLLVEIQAARQAMLLHGLTEPQIAGIEQNRTLVREVTIYAPSLHGDDSLHHESEHDHEHGHRRDDTRGEPSLPPGAAPQTTISAQGAAAPPQHEREAEFLVTELNVNRGQAIDAGQPLAQLSDYTQVLIEGHAFQKDAKALRIAANLGLRLEAVIDSTGRRPEIIEGLGIAYIGNQVELDSRALPFFVPLENRIERSEQRSDGRYVSWRFKPGQRLQIRVPLQRFDDTIVVPKDGVAEEGVERYVFVDHGDHFDRRPVRVLARDAIWVAIANDGSLRNGQKIAISGAHQLQMAMKKKAGGPIDPHAGHNH